MNVWILNHSAVTPDLPGGTRHFDIGKEFVEKEHNVVIFASDYHYSLRKYIKTKKANIFKKEYIGSIEFYWIRTFPYSKNNWRRVVNMLSYFFKTIYVGIKIKQKPEVIVGSSVHLLAVLAAYIIAKIKRSKFIFEVRDLWPQTLIDLGNYNKNNLFIIFMRQLEKYLYIKAKKIITLLPKASEYITKLGIPDEKIVWIPNGVDLKMFRNRTKRKSTNNQFLLI